MILFVIIALIVLCYIVLKPKMKKPPVLKGAWPIFGHIFTFIKNPQVLWTTISEASKDAQKQGGVVTIPMIVTDIFVITNPEDATTLINTSLQKDMFYDFLKPWLGDGLITSPESIWKRHRKLLNPAFNVTVLDSFLGQFNWQARALVDILSEKLGKGKFDHTPYIEDAALQTICCTAMGIANDKTDLQLRKEYLRAKSKFQDGVVQRAYSFWLHIDYIYKLTKLFKTQEELSNKLHSITNTIIQKRREEFNQITYDDKCFKPFLDLLLEMERDGIMSEKEIQEEVDTFTFAGSDTVSIALNISLLLVASHGDVQKKIHEELEDVFRGSDRDVDKQDLVQLKYLEAVIKESMRLFSPVALVGRILEKDVTLKNYTLPIGSRCYVLLQAVNTHQSWGTDAEQFRPERWLDPSLPVQSLASFGYGRRKCIGLNYSLLYLKTTLAHILRHYHVCGDVKELVMSLEVLSKPVHKPYLTIHKRHQCKG